MTDYDLKRGLPNKMVNENGIVTDMFGNTVANPSEVWESKASLPNKWINPDGTYSTLREIINGAIDINIFEIVDQLPASGDPQKIYLVPDGKGGFIEYHYKDNTWDPIGVIEIDLSDYPTREEVTNAITAALNAAKNYTDTAIQTSITNVLDSSY